MLTTEATAEQLLHIAHTERMLARLPTAPVDDGHADEVVACALRAVRPLGMLPAPHAHSLDEAVGACVDCDALALIALVDIELLGAA